MDKEIFILDEENGYSLIFNKDEKDSWFVELLDINQKVLFHYTCDTFRTGNLIYHLQKAIETFLKAHHKILLSRWYPKRDSRFLINIAGPDSILATIYKETESCYIKFMVTAETVENPISFVVPLKQIKEKIM